MRKAGEVLAELLALLALVVIIAAIGAAVWFSFADRQDWRARCAAAGGVPVQREAPDLLPHPVCLSGRAVLDLEATHARNP